MSWKMDDEKIAGMLCQMEHQSLINLISENIRETSPFVYDVAVHLAKTLEDTFQIQVIDEEIGLLSIYIGFIIEQSHTIDDKVKVLIICNDYKDMANNMLRLVSDSVFREELIRNSEIYCQSNG